MTLGGARRGRERAHRASGVEELGDEGGVRSGRPPVVKLMDLTANLKERGCPYTCQRPWAEVARWARALSMRSPIPQRWREGEVGHGGIPGIGRIAEIGNSGGRIRGGLLLFFFPPTLKSKGSFTGSPLRGGKPGETPRLGTLAQFHPPRVKLG